MIRPRRLPGWWLLSLLLLGALVPDPARAQLRVAGEEVRVRADALTFDRDTDTYHAAGRVEIETRGLILKADEVTLEALTGETRARGGVVLQQGTDLLFAEELTLNLNTERGVIVDGTLILEKEHYRITGPRIEKTGRESYRLTDGALTTCGCELGRRPTWVITGREVDVILNEYAFVTGATFRLLDVPVLYLPYGVFPIKRDRQSGLLTPHFSQSKRHGLSLELPVYWAISDQTDATLSPEYLAKRGVKWGGEFRYALAGQVEGQTNVFRLDDARRERTRWALRSRHDQPFPDGTTAKVDLNLVSDNEYVSDFSRDGFDAAAPQLRSQVIVAKAAEGSSLVTQFTHFRDLTLPDQAPVLHTLPRITYTRVRQAIEGGPLYYNLDSSFTHFERDRGLRGQRLDILPGLSWVTQPLGVLDVVPGLRLRETMYETSQGISGFQHRQLVQADLSVLTSLERIYPLAGGAFERLRHSVEPSVTYSFIPTISQRSLPEFDDVDRVPRTNLLTVGLTNRLQGRLAGAPGAPVRELGRLAFSQPVAFTQLEVQPPPAGGRQPLQNLTGQLVANPADDLSATIGGSYSHTKGHIVAYDALLSYRHPLGHAASVDYRYSKPDNINQLSPRFQLRLADLLAFAYESQYSYTDSRFLQSIYRLKLHSRCGCWELGFSIIDRKRPNDTEFAFTFTLRGLGSLGSGI
ncbi:MAG: LPS-assembly protein LptD [Deltaproteobacteria bacterium]|nr:LPS-assembly protein LptD [Deltaproteobacteria bacterium]